MKSTLILFSILVLFYYTTLSFASLTDGIDFYEYSQCAPQYQLSHNDQRICTNGHVITSLAMAMMMKKPKTFFNPLPNPKIYPNDIASYLLHKQQISSSIVFASTFQPEIITQLSSNMHYTTSFQPHQLNDEQTIQFCNQIVSSRAFYIVDMNQNGIQTTVWFTFCSENDEQNDMVLFYHHPIHGEKSILWSELISSSIINIHEILISYNMYEQQEFNQRQAVLETFPNYNPISYTFTSNAKQLYPTTQVSQWIVPHPYFISWKQGDFKDIMTTKTVAQVGCLMCSVAVALRNRAITLPGNIVVDPSTFNTYIKANDGYDQNNFIHTVINPICNGRTDCHTYYNPDDGRHSTNDLTPEQVITILQDGKRHVVLNVNNGGHFVPCVGWDKDKPEHFRVFDSAGGTHQREFYHHDEVVGYRLYDITGPYDNIQINNNNNNEELARSVGL